MTGRVGRPKRVTISDIAAASGVSAGAVSYALNGRRGVSEATRARIVAVAEDFGWVPSQAARRLHGIAVNTIGLVFAKPATMLGTEAYHMEFVAGVESVLSVEEVDMMLRVVSTLEQEMAVYRHWAASDRVDGVILVDPRIDDPRLRVLGDLGLPTVVVGEAAAELPLASSVVVENRDATADVVRWLVALGHRRLARVAGPPQVQHVVFRDDGFRQTGEHLGVETMPIIRSDFSADSGATATRQLLSARPPPTAIVFDNDVMAAASLSVCRELGYDVPRDLSLVSWDDSVLCRMARPTITALTRDVAAFGKAVATELLSLVRGGQPETISADRPLLQPRESTARAAA